MTQKSTVRSDSLLSLSPSARLLLITLVGVLACLVITVLALRTPWLGLTLTTADDNRGLLIERATGPTHLIAPGSRLLSLSAGAGFGLGPQRSATHVDLQTLDLIEDPGLLPSFADVLRLMTRQSQILDILRQPTVMLEWDTPSGARQTASATPLPTRPLASLPVMYWVQLLAGLLALILGSWVWVLRPHDWGARMFALTGAMMLTFTLPAAWYSTRELAVDGVWFSLLSGINISGAILFGCALIAIFLCFPRPLVRPLQLLWIPLVFGSLLVAELLRLWPMPLGNLITLVQTLVAVGCVVWQWRATRQHPASRAALRWVALSALVGAALFVVPMAAAPLLGVAPPVSQGLGFVFFLIMYAGIALGVARFRLFELDEWAYRILLWIAGVVLLLVVDAILLWALHFTPALSLGLALLLVGFLYLPLRNWLWQRLVSRHGVHEDTLFRSVLDVVLEPDDARRSGQWEKLLHTLYRPLELRALPDTVVTEPRIADEGLALLLPGTAGAPSVQLRYPWQGRGLFSREHLRLARRLLAFLAQADASRAEFAHGVAQERQRITRDLHDDIGSRLVTSLHQATDPALQRTLRNTLQDLRIILSGLAGESMSLPELLARLESETRERLSAARIALEWQEPDTVPPALLSYALYKNLLSAQREVISNVLRHSSAILVQVQVAWQAPNLTLTTTDFRDAGSPVQPPPDSGDSGTDMAPPSGLGMGTANLQQRLASLGGTIHAEAHAEGYQIRLCLPLPSTTLPDSP